MFKFNLEQQLLGIQNLPKMVGSEIKIKKLENKSRVPDFYSGKQNQFPDLPDINSPLRSFISNPFGYINTVVSGRDNFPPQVREIISTYGNTPITKLQIVRTPLSTALKTAMNLASLGNFNKRLQEMPYDDLFHLSLYVTLNNNKVILLEKNQVINAEVNPSISQNSQTSIIKNIPPNLTINSLIEKAHNKLKNNMFTYDGRTNNCQDFILAMVDTFATSQEINFIKQNTENVFKGLPIFEGIVKKTTDIGAKINEIQFGAGIHPSKIQSILFDKSHWTLQQCVKWLKKHNFKGREVDEKPNTFRFRQQSPKKFKRFITKELENGIDLIIGFV